LLSPTLEKPLFTPPKKQLLRRRGKRENTTPTFKNLLEEEKKLKIWQIKNKINSA
jgi:hypothetical protein